MMPSALSLTSPVLLVLGVAFFLLLVFMIAALFQLAALRKKASTSIKQASEKGKCAARAYTAIESTIRALPIGVLIVHRFDKHVEFISSEAAQTLGTRRNLASKATLDTLLQGVEAGKLSFVRKLVENPRINDEFLELTFSEHINEDQRVQTPSYLALQIIPNDVRELATVFIERRVRQAEGETDSREFEKAVFRDVLLESDIYKSISLTLGRFVDSHGSEISVALTCWNCRTHQLTLLSEANLPAQLKQLFVPPENLSASNAFNACLGLGKQVHRTLESFDQLLTPDYSGMLKKESIVRWSSYPLVGLNGEVIGALEVMSRAEAWPKGFQDNLIVAAKVLSVILERNEAVTQMSELLNVERTVRRINHLLMTDDKTDRRSGMSEALKALAIGADLPEREVKVLLRSWGDRVAVVGDDGSIANDAGMKATDMEVWVNERVGQESSELGGSGWETEESRFGFFIADSSDPSSRGFIAVISQNPNASQFLVFPLWWVGCLEGVMVIPVVKRLTHQQLSIVSSALVSLSGVVARHRLLTELQRKAHFDQLTGLANRAHMDELLLNEIQRCQRYHNPMTVLLLDIDHFKSINDTYGHDAGDRVLREISSRVKRSVRSADSLARWGGEEFVVMLTETGLSNAYVVAENIRRVVESGEYGLGKPVTVSIGASQFRQEDTVDTLLKRADLALYGAKSRGRNQVHAESQS